jgi:hypothetical protein
MRALPHLPGNHSAGFLLKAAGRLPGHGGAPYLFIFKKIRVRIRCRFKQCFGWDAIA